ncbi:MAG: enoyl-ACP reductase [Elusimicrobia bacterium]|nr:enoyl-ACP reductase [Elusimicrobiota bacterium]
MADLNGKTALIFGVASDTSIAWAIAKEMAEAGARIILAYQFRYHSRIKDLAPTLPNILSYDRCDVTKEDEMKAFFSKLSVPIDIVVHSIAFAPAATFQGNLLDVTPEDFSASLVASSYSLSKIMQYAAPRMTRGGSVLTLTYLGGQKVCANYRVMGVAKAALEAYVRELAFELGPKNIRVNAISAGPIKTLAAGGIKDFDYILDYHKSVAPLRENISTSDVASCAAFLASDKARRITGQILFVDAGYSIVGVPQLG